MKYKYFLALTFMYACPGKKDNSLSNVYRCVCKVEHSIYTFLH